MRLLRDVNEGLSPLCVPWEGGRDAVVSACFYGVCVPCVPCVPIFTTLTCARSQVKGFGGIGTQVRKVRNFDKETGFSDCRGRIRELILVKKKGPEGPVEFLILNPGFCEAEPVVLSV